MLKLKHLFNKVSIILLFDISIPITISFIKSIIKYYIPEKIKLKHTYLKTKKLDLEYQDTLNLTFKKEKEITNIQNNVINHQDRYLLEQTEKLAIYERITNLICNIKLINNQVIRSEFATKLTNIIQIFNDARIRFENMNSDKIQLFIQDKINIELEISNQLTKLEEKVKHYIDKENRMSNDDKTIKT